MSMPSGTVERLSKANVLELLRLPRLGRVLDLGMPIDRSMPQGDPRELFPFFMVQTVVPGESGQSFEASAEGIVASLHTSTHVDALCHVLADGRLYGGTRGGDARGASGWSMHGVETLPPIIARFIFIDVASLHGVEALDDAWEISVPEIDECLSRCGLGVEEGDAVLVRTGKIADFYAGSSTYGLSSPGLTVEAGIELHRRGAAVLGSDTPGTERLPFANPARTLHRAMLAERGVVLVENVNLTPLKEAAQYAGLFICVPLRIMGATASWVRPIAIV